MGDFWPNAASLLICLICSIPNDAAAQELPAARGKNVQTLELIPRRSGSWIFPLEAPPELVWRDAVAAAELGFPNPPAVRWFDHALRETVKPDHAGRWLAFVEGVAPNGFPFRRSFTFFALPKQIDVSSVPDLTIQFPNFPNEATPPLLREFQHEIERSAKDIFSRALMDNERTAILLSGIYESEPLNRPRRFSESSAVLNAKLHLALKRKLLGHPAVSQALEPPFRIEAGVTNRPPAPETPRRVPELTFAKEQIDKFCRDWAAATKEPFVTIVYFEDQLILHAAFGETNTGIPIDTNYRCWIASLTKTVTGLMFARFLDQGLLGLDDSVASVFSDYPANDPHVPTFRQCLNHTAGFDGVGEFGGINHVHFENVILNAIELNEPGKVHRYTGIGYELTAKAMEIVSGLAAPELYEQQLFQPLGFGDVVLGNASSDAEMTAAELGTLGQLLLGRGRHQGQQFFRPETFAQLLPRPTSATNAPPHDHGVGLHWIRHRRSAPGSPKDGELLFSSNTIGHGSFSGCILVVDLDRKIVIAQARRAFREEDKLWYQQFFEVIADSLNVREVEN
ncbi:MAG: beta-lactamase family protein [Planctomycetaceae bacterium]|nr:beta-lactamase family protein [Planctomycetaceae bacterium]